MDTFNCDEVLHTLEIERERLLQLREQLDRRYFSEDQEELSGEVNSVDQHDADYASATEMRELTLGLEGQLARRLAEVESAVERVLDGTYGICEICGRPIEPERLAVRPETRFCKEDAERLEAEARQHRKATDIGHA